MGPVLVVGATGQLGMATVKELLAQGRSVRALIRNPSATSRFQELGADVAIGDLTIPATLAAACRGASVIVATANAAVPSTSADTFEAVERNGYRNLVQAAVDAGVKRFVYTSIPQSCQKEPSLFFRLKRETEQLVEKSGMEYVIFRADVFMDVAFAMMGSLIPLRGTEAATALRPFPFSRNHLEGIKDSIEKKHVAMIPGDGRVRHAFICVDDVARFLTAAASGGPSGTHVLGGPEPLTYLDIVRLYEQFLGMKLRVKKTPAPVFWTLSKILKPFNPAGANIMRLNYLGATQESLADPTVATAFQLKLTTSEEFLRRKFALAPGH